MSAALVAWPEVVQPGTAPSPEEQHRARVLACIRTGDWLDAQNFPPLRWAVPGVIPEGFGLIVGPPKLGKSWLVLGIALAVATGGRAFGRIDVGPARPTLYLALEDGERRLQDRCRKLLADQPIPALFHYATTTETSIAETIDVWLGEHAEQHPLIVLDTLGKVIPPAAAGESAYSRDYRIGAHLKRLVDTRPGATLLVVHHTRKTDGADWMDSTSGTQGLNGSADFTIALTRARNETAAVLKVTGRDVREGEYAMTAADGSWRLDGPTLDAAAATAQEAKATAGLGDRSAEIVAYVARHAEGVSASDVEKDLGIENARRYLTRLADNGRIVRARRGTYTPTPVPSVPSVPNEWDTGPDGTHGTHGTHPNPLCIECGYPLPDTLQDAGETTHPNCGA